MRGLSFSQKLIASAVLGLIVCFGCYAIYTDAVQRKLMTENVDSYIEVSAKGAADKISEWLNVRMQLALVASQSIQKELGDPVGVEKIVSLPVYKDNFDLTYFGSSEVARFIRSPNISMPDKYDFRTRPLYKTTVENNGVTLLQPYVDAATGGLVASIGVPVYKDSTLLGVFGVDLGLDTLVKYVFQLDLSGLGYVFFVNSEGKVIASPKEGQQGKTLVELFGIKSSVTEGAKLKTDIQGGTTTLYLKKITGIPTDTWYLALVIDENKAYASLQQSRLSAIVALLVMAMLLVCLMVVLIRVLLAPLRNLNLAMRDISQGEGDLTKRLHCDSSDEFGQMSRSFNQFVDRISTSIHAVDDAASKLNVFSKQVLEGSRYALASSQDQAERVLVIAASVEELGATAQEIASNASHGASEASKVRAMSEQGQKLSQRSVDAIELLSQKVTSSRQSIESLSSKTEKIGAILDVIKGISEQTNLLALNAAIEAARAGDAGRGFAVVADEVRGLAHRTQLSALEINGMITELQSDALMAVDCMLESQPQGEGSVSMIQETGAGISDLSKGIGEIDRMNFSVAAATEEQSLVVGSLSEEINDISTRNRECVEVFNKNIEACAGLDEQALTLKALVGSFKLNSN